MAVNIKRRLRCSATILFVAMVLLLCSADAAWACPTCKDGLADSPNASNLVQGYFWSICFMMSMPFVILGGLGTYFYYEVRRARANSPESTLATGSAPGGLETSSLS
jgi:heme/copper-type cytochrome/quinol oxidase subunit 2